jgi:hypothetical protein
LYEKSFSGSAWRSPSPGGGGGVTAQEIKIGDGTLTLNGKVATGGFFDNENAEKKDDAGAPINDGNLGADGRVRMWNESDPGNGLRLDFTAAYTLKNAGFRIRLRADNDLAGESRTVVGRYAFGWIDLFDNLLRATGGYIDLSANVWGTQGDLDADIGGNGVRLEVKPIEGLNVGVFFLAPQSAETVFTTKAATPPATGYVTTSKTGTKFATAPQVLAETVFGARYVNPLFYVNLQFALDSDFDGSVVKKADGSVYSEAGDEQRLLFGVGLTAVENLTATVEGDINGLGNWAARGKGDLRQTVSYGIDKLTFGLKAQELLWGYDLKERFGLAYDSKSLSPWMQFKPFVEYQVQDNLTVGLEGGYGFGHAVEDVGEKAWANEEYNIFVKPNLSLSLGLLNVKFWYKFNLIGYANLWDGVAYENRNGSNIPETKDGKLVESLLKNQVALEFIWSF